MASAQDSSKSGSVVVVVGGDCCAAAPECYVPAPDPNPFAWSIDLGAGEPAWAALPALPSRRSVTCAAGVGGGATERGLLVAGDCRAWFPTDEAFVFRSGSAKWERAARTPRAMQFPSAVEVDGSAFVVAEAGLCLRYDSGSDRWEQLAQRPARLDSSGTASLGGLLWAVGGTHAAAAHVDTYDPRSGRWQAAPELTSRRQCAEAATCGGCLYVVGGFGSDGDLAGVERLDPRAGRWEEVAPMPAGPRWSLSCVECAGRLLALGGLADEEYLARGEIFDPTTGAWSQACPQLPSPRASFGLARM